MIDLSRLGGVQLDAAARRIRVAGGSLLGPVDREAQRQGLVTPMGTVSHTGVGGLTTGGGFGRVARRFGLALDNVTAVDVVTADGRLLHANPDETADLYWGVRGGGGNFGIVTSFEFRLHPMQRQVIGGDIVYPIERAAEVLSLYADFVSEAADDLYLDFLMMRPPGGGPGVSGISVCYSGPAAGAGKALEPLRKLGTPLNDGIKSVEYVDLQKSGDVTDPRAMGVYLKSGFSSEISTEMMRAIVEGHEPHPGRLTMFFTQHCGGAIGRVPSDAAAFAHRYAQVNSLAMVSWPAGDDGAPHMAWARAYWAGIEGFTRGWYTNEVASESAAEIDANYGPNYSRLVQLKNKYDPTNLFRLNANIRPA
jgi:FAD/FMN-containing dehydrogenase